MNTIRRCQAWLGTFVEVALSGPASETALSDVADRAFAAIRHVHRTMSVHDPESELSQVNRMAHVHRTPVSAALNEVLDNALALSKHSHGAFDVTAGTVLTRQQCLPPIIQKLDRSANWTCIDLSEDTVHFSRPLRIDLGGIAKGYAVDCASAIVPEELDFMINAGGDLRCRPWLGRSVLIRHPIRGNQGWPLALSLPALATSADRPNARYADVVGVDRRRLRRRRGSWSVAARTALLADGLTKVLQVHPAPGPIMRHFGARAFVLNANGTIAEVAAEIA